MSTPYSTLPEQAQHIDLLIVDIDGVMTDGGLYFDNNGEEYKRFSSLDGHGIRMWLECGKQLAIITGRQSELLLHRARNLGIDESMVFQGYRDKRPALKELHQRTGIINERIAYVGDDVIDLPIMCHVGLSIAVDNAHWFVKQHAHWQVNQSGGYGAVREACEGILHAQGLLEDKLNTYLQA